MKTRAAILYKINEPLTIQEIEIPKLTAGQVLVKIAYSGVCRTQLNEMQGLKGEDKFLPHTLGHEASGIVEEVGPQVNKVKAGDHVVATWIQGSGMNVPSVKYTGDKNKVINSGAISTFMERAIISENRLVKIPSEMSLRSAALLGCALPTGAGIVFNSLNGQNFNSIAIFGIGGIGLSAIIAAKAKEIPCIVAIDVKDEKLDQACELGATHIVNAWQADPVAEVMKITENKGVDCSIECAGNKEAMEAAFKITRYNGGLCVLAGNLRHGETISIDPMDLIRGKKLIGTWGGETNPDEDIPFYASQYLSGKLQLDKLITHEYTLDEMNTACEDLAQRRLGRAVVRMY
jgi:S-(hydroxymethyl)glutathione dehydrogenase/alcohol dehydrogenase